MLFLILILILAWTEKAVDSDGKTIKDVLKHHYIEENIYKYQLTLFRCVTNHVLCKEIPYNMVRQDKMDLNLSNSSSAILKTTVSSRAMTNQICDLIFVSTLLFKASRKRILFTSQITRKGQTRRGEIIMKLIQGHISRLFC